MRGPSAGRYHRRLQECSQAIFEYRKGADDDEAWCLTADMLGWLYRAELYEQRPDRDAYFTARAASQYGQTLGGLIWFRNRVDHEGESVVRNFGRHIAPSYSRVLSDEWVRSYGVLRPRDDDTPYEYDQWVWPSAAHLEPTPPPGKPNAKFRRDHQRWQWYRAHVEFVSWNLPVSFAVQWLIERPEHPQ